MKSVIGLATLCAVVAMTSGQANANKSGWRVSEVAASAKNPVEATPPALKAGAGLWTKSCASCHGARGRGDGPVAKKLETSLPDLSDSELLTTQTDGELFRKVTVGRKSMPGFKKLTDRQRWQLVVYMRTLAEAK